MGQQDERFMTMTAVFIASLVLSVGSILLGAGMILVVALLMWTFLVAFLGLVTNMPREAGEV